MEVLEDLVARDRRSEATALRVPAVGRSYDYRGFCTAAWKVGNLLRHLGVRHGSGVAIGDDPMPEAVLTLYGAACLGAVVRFDARPDPGGPPRALVVPTADLEAGAVPSVTKPVVYGDDHDDPAVAYFERDVWSENPAVPPGGVAPSDPLLGIDHGPATNRQVLEAAAGVVDRHDIGPATTVAIDPATSFARPSVVAAGLVAPILAGGTVALGARDAGEVAVGGTESDVEVDAILRGT
jgi:hypothetical protein